MINVLVHIESRFPADRVKIKNFVISYLSKKIGGDIEVGVSIVGDRKMKTLNTNYRQIHDSTDVLSFPINDAAASSHKDIEVGFNPEKSSPDKVMRLGDVIVSYPQAVMEAAQANTFVDKQIEFLIAHGLDHLMGIHHD